MDFLFILICVIALTCVGLACYGCYLKGYDNGCWNGIDEGIRSADSTWHRELVERKLGRLIHRNGSQIFVFHDAEGWND